MNNLNALAVNNVAVESENLLDSIVEQSRIARNDDEHVTTVPPVATRQ